MSVRSRQPDVLDDSTVQTLRKKNAISISVVCRAILCTCFRKNVVPAQPSCMVPCILEYPPRSHKQSVVGVKTVMHCYEYSMLFYFFGFFWLM